MNSKEPFRWRHCQAEIILLNVRWYLELIPKVNLKEQIGESLNELTNRKSLPHYSQHMSHNLY